jgi:hypothetical protein
LVAFGAGVAVGANLPKLRKQVGPLLEKLGLQMADFGDFLSAINGEEAAPKFKAAAPKAKRTKARRAKPRIVREEEIITPMPRRKASPVKMVPAANGTYDA